YLFYYMPAGKNAVLLHAAAFIETFPVPIGMLSEEAAESGNKDVRRQHHACKASRAREMADFMHGLLVRTDPVISSLRRRPKPGCQIRHEVVKFLVAPSEQGFAVLQALSLRKVGTVI
ncbi:Voltage-dependent T-type calcium channel subunit alpha-1H, partial [Frankliniella fusca]